LEDLPAKIYLHKHMSLLLRQYLEQRYDSHYVLTIIQFWLKKIIILKRMEIDKLLGASTYEAHRMYVARLDTPADAEY